jgi:hypothetical protein
VDEVVQAHVYTPLTPPNQVVTDISEAGSEALVRAMAKDPKDRYQSYDEFIMAMVIARGGLLRSQFSPEPAPEEDAKTKSWWRRTNLF